jgi:hypothetical protein
MEFVLVQIDQKTGQLMFLRELLQDDDQCVQRWSTDVRWGIKFDDFGDAKCLACYLSTEDSVVLVKEITDIA